MLELGLADRDIPVQEGFLMASWDIQSLQAVWWAPQPATLDLEALFLKVFGVGPDSSQKIQGLSIAQGSVNGSMIRLQFGLGRLDFFQTPVMTPDQFSLLNFDSGIAQFKNYVFEMGAGLSASRLAIVLMTSSVADSSEEASSRLIKLAGLPLPFSPTSDVVINVNHRKAAKSFSGKLNKIMKWHGEQMQLVEMGGAVPIIKVTHLASLSIDVNTAPGDRPETFSAEKSKGIFDEMLEAAKSMAESQTPAALA